jgi:hypothetical protein
VYSCQLKSACTHDYMNSSTQWVRTICSFGVLFETSIWPGFKVRVHGNVGSIILTDASHDLKLSAFESTMEVGYLLMPLMFPGYPSLCHLIPRKKIGHRFLNADLLDMQAAMNGHKQSVTTLARLRVEVDAKDASQQTPLHLARVTLQFQCIMLCLDCWYWIYSGCFSWARRHFCWAFEIQGRRQCHGQSRQEADKSGQDRCMQNAADSGTKRLPLQVSDI